ncbi:hypothetical protein ACFQBQ_11305 [Granulicella cerasi]|uniref:Lipocalin-like domain-containing protein n=1 Tax=Granulicella cerasi TaxID=741063 RepID=A0ABW1ZAU0_9BACT|nr:hypothetical protein [Granulicella cerasi]
MAGVATTSAEPLPSRLQGTWRITRVLPTSNRSCWNRNQAMPLVGSTLTYTPSAMRWQGGEVTLTDIATRTVTANDFSEENPGEAGKSASFTQLGIHAPQVVEVDMQHEDMDITGATTEVPGDSVLIAGPGRIVVSACGVYFEATRTGGVERASIRR